MPLQPGTRVGPYEILSTIGVGGMGEVYRARDPKLGREIAIKVLPGDVASDPLRRQRFEQGAWSASALNHPSILTMGARRARSAGFVFGLCLAASRARGEAALSVTIIGDPGDSRVKAVEQAVTFWNEELQRLGAGVRLGPVRFDHDGDADQILRDLERGEIGVRDTRGLARRLAELPGEVIVALSEGEGMSFGVAWSARSKGFVSLRRGDIEPLSLPNVARNAAAHELGHALGLGHNADTATLMCGRPAPCRPDTFASETPRFFPLTPDEERRLRSLWPR